MSLLARSAFVLLLGAGLTAQSQQPTFRTGVQLIEVDVRVFDKDGRFVPDLTKEDFEILEQGTSQTIDAMFLVADQTGARSGPGRGQVGAASGPGRGQTPSAPQIWIFLFDLQHLNPGGYDRSRKAVEDFLANRFKDGDLAGIVAGDKMINNRLTSVRQELLDAVKQVKPSNDSRRRLMEMTVEWPRLLDQEEAIRIARSEREPTQRAIMRACSDDEFQCRFADTAVPEKARTIAGEIHRATMAILNGMNGLTTGLARIPGPKTVVLISDGFAVLELETSLRSVVGQTARAGARVYAIDTRGTNRSGAASVEQMQATDEAGGPARTDSVADGPNSLAIDTGGLMIRNENNIGRALDRIADDAGTYYVLAYQPANTDFDGKYRPIEVKVTRPGLRVRARRGYLALEPAKMLRPQPIKVPTDPTLPAVPSAAATSPAKSEASPAPAPAAGAVVAAPSTVPEGTVRLRPDSQSRVKALSSRETAPASALVSRGWEAYQRGDVEGALAAFTEASSHGEVPPWVHYATGLSHAALGHTVAALSAWERVRKTAPDFEPVYMDIADTYAQTGDLTRALASLRDAEKRWPKNGDIQSAIGVIHVRRGALDDGIAALTRAAEARPDDPLAYLNLGRAYELRFHRGRRYIDSQRRWVAPEEDRTKAADAYQRCIKLGGPYAQKAAEALSMLEWGKAGQAGSNRR